MRDEIAKSPRGASVPSETTSARLMQEQKADQIQRLGLPAERIELCYAPEFVFLFS